MGMTRRSFLVAGAAGVLAACTGGGSDSGGSPTTTALRRVPTPLTGLTTNPFTLGVASGDPLHDRVMLWTRLAPDPLVAGGGMPPEAVRVRLDVARDDAMRDLVSSSIVTASPALGHAIRVDARALEPDRPYWYRFAVGDYETAIGRTRTAPRIDGRARRLTIGHASCQHWSSGYFGAFADMAAADVDLVVHCGDYIYENGSTGPVRADPLPESLDLEQYRTRWALYKTDENLQAAHAVAPWIMTPDDHEVDNDYTGGAAEDTSPTPDPASFEQRRVAAYRAWWESTPTRVPEPRGSSIDLYRRVRWGTLADFAVLDTRQYRANQCAGTIADTVGPRCDASFVDDFSVLGPDQERWFARVMSDRAATWTAIVQQVVLHQWRFAPGNGAWNLDQWDGYPAARNRLVTAMGAHDNVVLTGDVHSSWVSDLRADFDDEASERVGTEFVAPGVASQAPPVLGAALEPLRENSLHIRYAEVSKRGWVRHTVSPSEWNADFRLVDDAGTVDSPVVTASRWSVPAGGTVRSV